MNICLKILLVIISTGLLTVCAWSSENDVPIAKTMKQLCKEAMYALQRTCLRVGLPGQSVYQDSGRACNLQ